MKAVLFDLDDTLYPELAFARSGFAAAAAFLEARYGLDRDATTDRMMEVLHQDGRGHVFETVVTEALGSAEVQITPTLLYIYRSHRPRLQPYPDVNPLLRRLSDAGLRLGVLTDGLASVQRRKLDALELGVPLDVIVVAGELPGSMAKPSPAAYAIALELLGLPATEVAYVGNDPYKDFAGARAVGMRTIRVRAPSATFPVAADAIEVDADRYVDPFPAIADVVLTPD
jgi:putative hydrolase of the HAD superfamily